MEVIKDIQILNEEKRLEKSHGMPEKRLEISGKTWGVFSKESGHKTNTFHFLGISISDVLIT